MKKTDCTRTKADEKRKGGWKHMCVLVLGVCLMAGVVAAYAWGWSEDQNTSTNGAQNAIQQLPLLTNAEIDATTKTGDAGKAGKVVMAYLVDTISPFDSYDENTITGITPIPERGVFVVSAFVGRGLFPRHLTILVDMQTNTVVGVY